MVKEHLVGVSRLSVNRYTLSCSPQASPQPGHQPTNQSISSCFYYFLPVFCFFFPYFFFFFFLQSCQPESLSDRPTAIVCSAWWRTSRLGTHAAAREKKKKKTHGPRNLIFRQWRIVFVHRCCCSVFVACASFFFFFFPFFLPFPSPCFAARSPRLLVAAILVWQCLASPG